MTASERIIVALDLPSAGEALNLVDTLGDAASFYKIGLQLFCAEGPSIVRAVRERGKRVFLDLKFHDIPNTVAGAVRSVCALGIDMLTIHAVGGRSMIHAAVEAASQSASTPLVLGVTVLTSVDNAALREVNISATAADQVQHLALMAHDAGLKGLVCSPEEVAAIRRALPDIKLVVPGIRPSGAARGDQSRIATPREAITAGADYLVIGRPITAAADPRAALEQIAAEIS